ncbi:cyclin-dependent kinase 4 inhibitor B-like [Crotalus adamanteus]|uniref:Cyclin-dependent kinase 4 inhibitor B-like n=1 Tax=Crotalus adamanteus TaxID=8729 RepID=A0AAW1C154_CROAD
MNRSDRLSRAAAEGNVAELRRLLDEGADPNGLNAYGRSAIQVEGRAAWTGRSVLASAVLGVGEGGGGASRFLRRVSSPKGGKARVCADGEACFFFGGGGGETSIKRKWTRENGERKWIPAITGLGNKRRPRAIAQPSRSKSARAPLGRNLDGA